MSKLWLPEGAHTDLNIIHAPAGGHAGPFAGGGWKFVLHTTESSVESLDVILRVLRDKRAEPHFVLGYRKGHRFPTLAQMLPLNVAGRTLRNPGRVPEGTNRARAIQVEICGFAAQSPGWSDNWLKAIANMICWTRNRVPIPAKRPRSFANPSRYTDRGWVNASGIVGHVHCPGNDHTDPGHVNATRLVKFVKSGPHNLKPR